MASVISVASPVTCCAEPVSVNVAITKPTKVQLRLSVSLITLIIQLPTCLNIASPKYKSCHRYYSSQNNWHYNFLCFFSLVLCHVVTYLRKIYFLYVYIYKSLYRIFYKVLELYLCNNISKGVVLYICVLHCSSYILFNSFSYYFVIFNCFSNDSYILCFYLEYFSDNFYLFFSKLLNICNSFLNNSLYYLLYFFCSLVQVLYTNIIYLFEYFNNFFDSSFFYYNLFYNFLYFSYFNSNFLFSKFYLFQVLFVGYLSSDILVNNFLYWLIQNFLDILFNFFINNLLLYFILYWYFIHDFGNNIFQIKFNNLELNREFFKLHNFFFNNFLFRCVEYSIIILRNDDFHIFFNFFNDYLLFYNIIFSFFFDRFNYVTISTLYLCVSHKATKLILIIYTLLVTLNSSIIDISLCISLINTFYFYIDNNLFGWWW